MQALRQTLLCSYRYDPLDRLANCTPTAQASSHRFYLNDRLSTEIQGVLQHSIMQHEDQLLAQQQHQNGTPESHLLATDQQRSVLCILDAIRPQPLAYAPYGHRVPESSLLGFNGELPDPVTGHYLLGNGYRAFNPVLMRFNSPDSWSPFGRGGLNSYGYCVGDPINQIDPTGHLGNPIKGIMNLFGLRTPSKTGTINNLTLLAQDVYAFTDDSKSGPRLNIAAHGFVDPAAPNKKIVDIKAGDEEWTANHLYKKLAKEFNLNKVGEIRLLVCGSANENKSSFAQQFSNLTGKPVTGHKNIVSFTPPFKSVEDLWIKSQSIPNGEKHFRNHPKLQRYLIKQQTPRTFTPNIR